MNEPRKVLSAEQTALVTELVEAYDIEPESVLFYDDSTKPFLMYEASAILANFLAKISSIEIEPIPPVSEDAISVRCALTLSNSLYRSAVGAANTAERINDNEASYAQLYNLAASRALRNALKAAGIDLIKRHFAAKAGTDGLELKVKSNYKSLLDQAHAIGAEKGLIKGPDKSLWYHELWSRYKVAHSNQLTEEQLADFVAFLKAYEPPAYVM